MSKMRRVVLMAVGLTLVQPALAAEKKKRDPSAKVKAAQEKPPAVDPKTVERVGSERYLFISRVDMCAPPQRCDAETVGIVDEAEQKFLAACAACAPQKKCEEDRASIRAGKASRHANPCQ